MKREESALSKFSKSLPTLVDYAVSLFPPFAAKNHLRNGFVELLVRLVSCAFQRNFHVGLCCHYLHDQRLKKFTDAGCCEFATKLESIPDLRTFQPRIFAWTLWNFMRISWHLFPASFCPRYGLLRLAILDLACLWTLCKRCGISHFYVAAHFQPYVFVVCLLREEGIIERLSGVQHGAWAQSTLDKCDRDMPFDDYLLLHPRFESVFRSYFDRNSQVQLTWKERSDAVKWSIRRGSHIAVALQNDDYKSDFQIVGICRRVAERLGVEVVVYPHPRPIVRKTRLTRLTDGCRVVQCERFRNSICLVTRYSTLGIQFATLGGCSIFVDCGERIVFDTAGLDVCYVKLDEFERTLAGIVETPLRTPRRVCA